MSLIVPDPAEGEPIFPWARQIAKALRSLIPQPSRDIWPRVSTAGTTFEMRRRRSGGGEGGSQRRRPFEVFPVAPPEGEDAESKGWFKVYLHSRLSFDIGPRSKVLITGLDTAKQLKLEEEEKIWLRVNLLPYYEEEAEPPEGKIDCGTDWSPEEKDFFEDGDGIIEFSTDNGTPEGTDETPPANRKPVAFYVPIAETIEHDEDDQYEPPGIMLDDTWKLVQLVDTHLWIVETCYRGLSVPYVMPGLSHFYHTDDDEEDP